MTVFSDPHIVYFLFYLLLGAFAGTAAGLLGIGGGLLIVPALAFIFQQQGMSADIIMHLALGTSLATIIFTSLSSIWAHHQRNAVLWPVVWRLAPGILMGAWLGSAVVGLLPTNSLMIIFGFFELYVAIQMTLGFKPESQRVLPNAPGMTAAGVSIGSLSSIVGIGGGTLTVPFLLWCNTTIRKAIATSAACGLPIAISGGVGFLWFGWEEAVLPEYSLGYIYLPALLGIVMTSILFAPLGAWLAHRLETKLLKRIFAVLLYILALRMLIVVSF